MNGRVRDVIAAIVPRVLLFIPGFVFGVLATIRYGPLDALSHHIVGGVVGGLVLAIGGWEFARAIWGRRL